MLLSNTLSIHPAGRKKCLSQLQQHSSAERHSTKLTSVDQDERPRCSERFSQASVRLFPQVDLNTSCLPGKINDWLDPCKKIGVGGWGSKSIQEATALPAETHLEESDCKQIIIPMSNVKVFSCVHSQYTTVFTACSAALKRTMVIDKDTATAERRKHGPQVCVILCLCWCGSFLLMVITFWSKSSCNKAKPFPSGVYEAFQMLPQQKDHRWWWWSLCCTGWNRSIQLLLTEPKKLSSRKWQQLQ